MWSKQVFGTDTYHLIAFFVIYSILGWFVESVYMSMCNRKLTNRGFTLTPFCPIYGFGAVGGYIFFGPLRDNLLLLYVFGSITATIFEYVTAKIMLRVLGEVWWDYSEKPLNYQGIICLESSIAWGFYAIAIVNYLNDFFFKLLRGIPNVIGIRMCTIILLVVCLDFTYHLVIALGINMKEQRARIVDRYQEFKTRWY